MMGARTAVVLGWLAVVGVAHADPTPQKIDSKPFRDQLLVFTDSASNVYVIKPENRPASAPVEPARVWFGSPNKPVYEQVVTGLSRNGSAWSVQTWAPRIIGIRPGYLSQKADGTWTKSCGDQDAISLTQHTGDKAKALLDKSPLMSEYLMRRAHMLARDDSGTYYYVDKLSKEYGSKGFRIYMGRKGAMKQMPLSDVASDTAGEVFSTKTGDLRLDRRADSKKMVWIRGEKRTELITLDVDANSPVIFADLGIYPFLGTICDNM